MADSRAMASICRRLRLALALSGLLFTLSAAYAEERVVYLDSQRSHADFDVRALWMFDVSGRFEKVGGTVVVDPFHHRARVDVRIDAATVRMDNAKRETWVRSAEFFDVERYPQINFESEPFPLQRLEDGGELSGSLTVRGITRPITFTLLPALCDEPANDCAVEAEGFIYRSEFGMSSRRGMLSNTVRLSFVMFVQPSSQLLLN